eukprot:7235-Pelagococcus_subviridis.AAC.2
MIQFESPASVATRLNGQAEAKTGGSRRARRPLPRRIRGERTRGQAPYRARTRRRDATRDSVPVNRARE